MFNNLKLSLKMIIPFTIIASLLLISTISITIYLINKIHTTFVATISVAVNNNEDRVNNFFSRFSIMTKTIEDKNSNILPPLLNYNYNLNKDVKVYNEIKQRLKSNVDNVLLDQMPYYNAYFFINDDIPFASIFQNSYEGIYKSEAYSNSVLPYNSKGIKNEFWYDMIKKSNDEGIWFTSENQKLCFVKPLSYIGNDYSNPQIIKMGILFFSFDAQLLLNKIDMTQLSPNTTILLVHNERVVYSNSKGYLNGSFSSMDSINKNKNIIYINKLNGGLELITIIPKDFVNQLTNSQILIIIFFGLSFVILGIFLSIYNEKTIVKPITLLSKHVTNEDLTEIDCSAVNQDEIGKLYNNYNEMVNKIKQLIIEIQKVSEEKQKTYLKMLQAQINPHFTYNVLDSVCCVSLMRGHNDIAATLSKLATLMRYNIKDPDIIVPITEEMSIINAFIEIQKFKYGNTIAVEYCISAELDKIFIPKMSLQPLVENSIYHGMKYIKGKELKIKITVTATDEIATITVHDNTQNVNVEDIIAHLYNKKTLSSETGGLGIRNVLERIRMTYGNDYGLYYEIAEDAGLNAIVKIPLQS